MPTQSRPPNILVFFSDQQRWDTAGCYGQKLPVTPNLDRMAAEGVRFEHAITCQPVCGPARATLQTGRYPTELGCFRNDIALPEDVPTLAQRLTQIGYSPGYVGKWHLASTSGVEGRVDERYWHDPIPPERRGGYDGFWRASDLLEFTSHGYGGYLFDENMSKVTFSGYRTDAVTDQALAYLDQQDGETPFFLFLSHIEPHHQNDHGHYEGPVGSRDAFRDFDVPEDLAGLPGDYMEEYPDYLGCCNRLDHNLGRVMDRLKEKGLYDNTVILYLSDHGSHFRTRNRDPEPGCYDDYKRSCHDSCVRIPMVIRGPGIPSGRVVRSVVSLLSVPRTLLSLAGADGSDAMRGEDLSRYWRQDGYRGFNEAFLQISESQVGRALRTPEWKYAVRAPGGRGNDQMDSEVYVEDFLYDLTRDPHERTNLVRDPDYAAIRQQLAGRLLAHMVDAGERKPEIRPASN